MGERGTAACAATPGDSPPPPRQAQRRTCSDGRLPARAAWAPTQGVAHALGRISPWHAPKAPTSTCGAPPASPGDPGPARCTWQSPVQSTQKEVRGEVGRAMEALSRWHVLRGPHLTDVVNPHMGRKGQGQGEGWHGTKAARPQTRRAWLVLPWEQHPSNAAWCVVPLAAFHTYRPGLERPRHGSACPQPALARPTSSRSSYVSFLPGYH